MRQLNENEHENITQTMQKEIRRNGEREKKERVGGERKRSKCVCFENKFDIQLTKPLCLIAGGMKWPSDLP